MRQNIKNRFTGNNLGKKQKKKQNSGKNWQNQEKDGQKFEWSRMCCLSDEKSENAFIKI